MCGEQAALAGAAGWAAGSSPRVRGTECAATAPRMPLRFIPACAGNRAALVLLPLYTPVHPRVCGEQWLLAALAAAAGGSSPRVRGTAVCPYAIACRSRFIPACAGNRPGPGRDPVPDPVHPRVCGEQAIASLAQTAVVGSSPRVRGTERSLAPLLLVLRFIPACAGNRSNATIWNRQCAVHPRVCGEQGGLGGFSPPSIGSS